MYALSFWLGLMQVLLVTLPFGAIFNLHRQYGTDPAALSYVLSGFVSVKVSGGFQSTESISLSGQKCQSELVE